MCIMRKARNTSKKRWSCTNIKQEIQSGAATMCMRMLLLMIMPWKVVLKAAQRITVDTLTRKQ